MNWPHRCLAVLALMFGSTLHAQTIIGTWQGTLPITQYPRTVLNIAKTDNGSLGGSLYRPDRYASGIPFSSVTFRSSNLNISVAVLDATYQGKLSPDGKSLTGVWVQDKQSYPLNLVLATPDTLWKYASAAPLTPMAAAADPAFEVATIKPSLPDTPRYHSRDSRDFVAKGMTLTGLIRFAYQVRSRQIEGGPSWTGWPKI